ncbi:MAG: hypothetical protein ABR585_15495 [Gemmatimonadaceae bacterium]
MASSTPGADRSRASTSGGIACVAGTLLIALTVPALLRYDARKAGA